MRKQIWQLYSLLVYTHPFTSTSWKNFNKLFKTDSFDWKQIYLLPRLVLVLFIIKPWTMFFIWIKNVLHFENRLHIFVLSANVLMRQRSIYFTMQYDKNMEWPGFILWKRLHFVWSNTTGFLFRFPSCQLKSTLNTKSLPFNI